MSSQTLLGANVENLDSLARSLETAARQLSSLTSRLKYQRSQIGVRAVDCWDGPDAQQLRHYLHSNVILVSTTAEQTVSGLARRVKHHAAAQRAASQPEPRWRIDYMSPYGDGLWVARYGALHDTSMVILIPGVGNDLRDVDRLSDTAQRLWSALNDVGDISVMVWLGYDPPDSLISGIGREPAQDGAAALQADIASLRRSGIANIYVVGHSYGALVSAMALTASESPDTQPDALVLLGSPGTGAGPLPPNPDTRVWAARADGDLIEYVARIPFVHGHDPLVEAKQLPTSLTGHSAYLEDPSIVNSLVNLISLHENQPETE